MTGTNNTRRGILAAGNWIVDHIKIIDDYPAQDGLANIISEQAGNGGSPFNVLKDLSRLGAPFPLKAIGLVGDDDNGEWIKRECARHNINTDALATIGNAATSYTDVMSVEPTGRRTFFHQRGANAFLDESFFDFSESGEKIFHLGYLLLLDALDAIDEKGMTGAAMVLQNAQKSGLQTCVDLVSSSSPDFKKIVKPSLPFIDYLFLNEFEAHRCTDVNLSDEPVRIDAFEAAADLLFQSGIRSWVFIHFSKGVFAKSRNGQSLFQGALDIPLQKIVSTVGAGDALLAGTLLGMHENWPMQESLKLGVCAAGSSLFSAACSDGIKHVDECSKLAKIYSFFTI